MVHHDTPLDALPHSARLWIFGASRDLAPSEESRLLAEVDAFLDGWKAHGHPLAAARDWRYGRFLLVGVDDGVTPPSGCSIDALVRRLKGLERELEVSLVGSAPVWFRENGEIRRVSRADFKTLARRGEVDADTVVFDLSLTHLRALRDGEWETRAADSWHQRYLA